MLITEVAEVIQRAHAGDWEWRLESETAYTWFLTAPGDHYGYSVSWAKDGTRCECAYTLAPLEEELRFAQSTLAQWGVESTITKAEGK